MLTLFLQLLYLYLRKEEKPNNMFAKLTSRGERLNEVNDSSMTPQSAVSEFLELEQPQQRYTTIYFEFSLLPYYTVRREI